MAGVVFQFIGYCSARTMSEDLEESELVDM